MDLEKNIVKFVLRTFDMEIILLSACFIPLHIFFPISYVVKEVLVVIAFFAYFEQMSCLFLTSDLTSLSGTMVTS